MPDQYAGEVPALFVVPAAGAEIDPETLRGFLETHVHEAPARPRSIKVIDALPVTAVGKIFKPTLRDLAIQEKVRLEVERICGPKASAEATVLLDSKKNTVVDIAVRGAKPDTLAELEAALKPLPQTYTIRTAD